MYHAGITEPAQKIHQCNEFKLLVVVADEQTPSAVLLNHGGVAACPYRNIVTLQDFSCGRQNANSISKFPYFTDEGRSPVHVVANGTPIVFPAPIYLLGIPHLCRV